MALGLLDWATVFVYSRYPQALSRSVSNSFLKKGSFGFVSE